MFTSLGKGRPPFRSRSPLASAFAHAIAGAALWPVFRGADTPAKAWVVGAALAVIPDLDVIGFRFGVAYGDLLGHRGLTHSLVVAVVVGATVGLLLTRRSTSDTRWRVAAYLIVAMASHGLLDTMTTGGLGVALFAPLVDARYFLPWRPIAVSPIGIRPFFTMHGLAILANEALWVGVPSLLVATTGWRLRRPAIASSNRAPTTHEPDVDPPRHTFDR